LEMGGNGYGLTKTSRVFKGDEGVEGGPRGKTKGKGGSARRNQNNKLEGKGGRYPGSGLDRPN